jgi:hypothetical protein
MWSFSQVRSEQSAADAGCETEISAAVSDSRNDYAHSLKATSPTETADREVRWFPLRYRWLIGLIRTVARLRARCLRRLTFSERSRTASGQRDPADQALHVCIVRTRSRHGVALDRPIVFTCQGDKRHRNVSDKIRNMCRRVPVCADIDIRDTQNTGVQCLRNPRIGVSKNRTVVPTAQACQTGADIRKQSCAANDTGSNCSAATLTPPTERPQPNPLNHWRVASGRTLAIIASADSSSR